MPMARAGSAVVRRNQLQGDQVNVSTVRGLEQRMSLWKLSELLSSYFAADTHVTPALTSHFHGDVIHPWCFAAEFA